METAILLAVAASLCTATSSVCQRIGAKSIQTTGFDARLMFRLARRPVWLLGIASMIGGFVFQLTALHFGALALVQPILGRPPCCWPRTPWRPVRWRPPSQGSPSSTRCRPACSACSCSASTSGLGPLT